MLSIFLASLQPYSCRSRRLLSYHTGGPADEVTRSDKYVTYLANWWSMMGICVLSAGSFPVGDSCTIRYQPLLQLGDLLLVLFVFQIAKFLSVFALLLVLELL